MDNILKDNVKAVRISSRLKDDPVCLVSDENGVSLEMEKLLSRDPNHSGFKASKILEINPDHAIFAKLQELKEKDPEVLKEYTDVLFQQALLIQGLEIEDPVAYAKKIVDLMLK